MADWVRVSEFAKLAGMSRQMAYQKAGQYPEYVRKIDNVNHVSTELLDVLQGKADVRPPEPAKEPEAQQDITDDTPYAAEPSKPLELDGDGRQTMYIQELTETVDRLKAELSEERRKNEELNRQILDIVRKSQDQTDRILQIADQAQQLARGSQLLQERAGFFRRLLGGKKD